MEPSQKKRKIDDSDLSHRVLYPPKKNENIDSHKNHVASTSSEARGCPTTKDEGITFKVSDVKFTEQPPTSVDLRQWIAANGGLLRATRSNTEACWDPPEYTDQGKILLISESDLHPFGGRFQHGFVSACLEAYNRHCRLIIRPDDVWISITTALSRFLEHGENAETMRSLFVEHTDKAELTVMGGGSLESADYPTLIAALTDAIDCHTKDSLRDWLECNFSTTTARSRLVSKMVFLSTMAHYFAYKMCLCCGLPAVTLSGTRADWLDIRHRVDRLKEWGLGDWADALTEVLDHFVMAFDGSVDCTWWNRIAHITGGGSGPRYLEGWINVFIGWDDGHRFIPVGPGLYGKVDSNDVPSSMVEVPVEVDDNGKLHKVIFYAGISHPVFNDDSFSPSIESLHTWALIDVTDCSRVTG